MERIVTYRNRKTRETLQLKADFAQASSPIMSRWTGDRDWQSTPYQVADARHRDRLALKLVATWGG